MKVIVDAMGGDNAPLEIIKGCAAAVKSQDVDILLTGDEEMIHRLAADNGIPLERIEIRTATETISMEEDPSTAVRRKPNSSMAVGLRALANGEGDAFISAGSTGALLSGATLIVKRIKGIKRAALSPLLPGREGPVMLIDCGANVECTPEYLLQFGVMGGLYMKKVCGVSTPKVGLANIGTEECKGGELQREALPLLREGCDGFIGNVEPSNIPLGVVDVVVCDGFTGNIILKTIEGMGKFLSGKVKEIFFKNILAKISALIVKDGLRAFKRSMDASEAGGAPFLGISKPVIKAHGNSNARAIECAVRQAKFFAQSGMIEEIRERFAK